MTREVYENSSPEEQKRWDDFVYKLATIYLVPFLENVQNNLSKEKELKKALVNYTN